MLTMLAHNLNRDVTEVRLFEMGTVFGGSTVAVQEQPGLALGATGGAGSSPLANSGDALFYALKGALERLLALFDTGTVSFVADEIPAWLETGRAARMVGNGKTLAVFGELNAAEAQRRKLRQTVVLAEVQLAELLKLSPRQRAVRELSRFQTVERDFSFVFADSVPWQQIAAAIAGLNLAELVRVTPVEIFRDARGKAVPAGHHSLLLRVVFQSAERTLVDDELTGWSARIVESLTKLGGSLRG
jgi:phenylalanyl-tRNA synthetase beta chain